MKTLLLPLLLTIATRSVVAAPLPYDQIQISASAETEDGAYSLWSWKDREKFPAVAEFSGPVEKVARSAAISWLLPASAGAIDVSEGSLSLQVKGRADWSERYKWAPIVLFRPKQAGAFRLSGQVTFASGRKEAEQRCMRWAVVKLQGESFTVVVEGVADKGQLLDLGALPELAAVKLSPEEQLGFTAWRHVWHWNGTARVREFEVARLP